MPWQLGVLWPATTGGGDCDVLTQEGSVAVAAQNHFHICAFGDYLFIPGGGNSTVRSIDVTDRANPVAADTLTDPTDTELFNMRGVATDGDWLYVTGEEGVVVGDFLFTIVNVSDPTNMTIEGSVTSASFGLGRGVAVQGDFCYVVAGPGGNFLVVDVSDRTDPQIVGSVSLFSESSDVIADGNFCYVTCSGTDRVVSIDVSVPTAPVVEDSEIDATTLDGCTGMALFGDVLFVAVTTGDRLTAIDVSDPSNLAQISSLADTDFDGISGVALTADGTRAVVGSYVIGDWVTLVDVSDPSAMVILDTIANNDDYSLRLTRLDGYFYGTDAAGVHSVHTWFIEGCGGGSGWSL